MIYEIEPTLIIRIGSFVFLMLICIAKSCGYKTPVGR